MRHSVAQIGEHDVADDGDEDHRDVAPVELIEQHADDQRELDDRSARSCMITMRTMVSMPLRPRSSTRVSPPVLRSRWKRSDSWCMCSKIMIGEPAHRVHRHLGEDAVAHLGEHRHQDAHAAIGDRHQDRRGQHPGQPGRRRDRRTALPGQRVGRPLEGERHRDGGELGAQQQHHRDHDAQLQVAPVGRPDIGPQPTHRREQRAAVGGNSRFSARSTRKVSHHDDPARPDGPQGRPSSAHSYRIFPDGNHPLGHRAGPLRQAFRRAVCRLTPPGNAATSRVQ